MRLTSSAADNMPRPDNCNNLRVVVEDAEHPQSGRCFSWGPEGYKRGIYMAAASGDWIGASSYDKIDPQWVRTPLTASGNTALHIAVNMKQNSFVAKLVDCISKEDTEIRMIDGNTAFCLAAISGNVEIAAILLRKNPNLVRIRGHKEMLPIQLASSAGHPQMAEFLYQETLEDLHNLPFQDIIRLFFFTITNRIYVVALNLLRRYPELAIAENDGELTALQILAQFPFNEEASGRYREILSSLFEGMEMKEYLDSVKPSKAMFEAVKSGNITTLKFLLKYNPDLLMEVNSKEQSLLHIAIVFRQEAMYRLILSKGAAKDVMMEMVDFDGNNVLHLAGKLVPEGRFGLTTSHVLMRNEELWFWEVEKIVPPALKTMRNKCGYTPKELFNREHTELYEQAVSALKGTANTLLVVATLVVTLGITGALTILTVDTNNQHTPIFPKKIWYIIFGLSVGIGNYLCGASMIFFGSVILPSNWKPKHENVVSQQRNLIAGNVSLMASLGLMVIAIASATVLISDFLPKWGFYVIAAFGCASAILYLTIYRGNLSHYILSVLAFPYVRELQ